MQCGAEKLLTQFRSALSPTNATDVYGCGVALAWSAMWMVSPLWPINTVLQWGGALGLSAVNATFLYRTFMHPQDQAFKKIAAAARKAKCGLVLGDWLLDDYDERLNQVCYFDELSEQILNTATSPMLAGVASDTLSIKQGGVSVTDRRSVRDQTSTFNEFMRNVNNLATGNMIHQKKVADLSIDDVNKSGEWMKSYRDVVNNRRLDLLAQVLNNCEGEKILMSVGQIDNLSPAIVSTLIQRRLTGDVSTNKPVFKYDQYYERVQVDM